MSFKFYTKKGDQSGLQFTEQDIKRLNRMRLSDPLTDDLLELFGYEFSVYTKQAVNKERDRRIAAGFTWNDNNYQSDADSLSNIAGAATSAVAFMVSGGSPTEIYWANPAQPFVWLTVDNTEVQMTPQDVVAFGNAAMAHKKNHIYAARTLKDMDPIPQDFTNEQYWP